VLQGRCDFPSFLALRFAYFFFLALNTHSSVHPRWLVKFDGPYKDEEMYEHAFSKVVANKGEHRHSGSSGDGESRRPTVSNNKKNHKSHSNASSRKSEAVNATDAQVLPPKHEHDETSKKLAAPSHENSPIGSEESSTPETDGRKKKVSAREQRSRRRQAIIDEFGVAVPSQPAPAGGKRKLAGNQKTAAKSKRQRHEEDGTCLKIKLLTGTLYLYRGRHRRAEFIRRV